jgi:hypothetical protein
MYTGIIWQCDTVPQVVQALAAVQDEEERSLLASNALGEAGGHELSIATDAACSRALEALLPAAAPAAVVAFARALAQADDYWELASRQAACSLYRLTTSVRGAWRQVSKGSAKSAGVFGQSPVPR